MIPRTTGSVSHADARGRTPTVTVDSGIGGALAATGMKDTPPLEEPLSHIGAMVCLPIGDKERSQIISYTAQMICPALVDQEADNIIIACNTASTVREEACVLLTDFVLSEADQGADRSIFGDQPEKLTRLKLLKRQIQEHAAKHPGNPNAKYGVLLSRVHEIITPTAKEAAKIAKDHLMENGQDTCFIQVDSTVGTLNSGQYPQKTRDAINKFMKEDGYEYIEDSFDESSSQNEMHGTTVQNCTFSFGGDGKNQKHVLIQSRGLPRWVPAIEGPNLKHKGEKLVRDALDDSRNSMTQAFQERFGARPNLNMACCTHYPAMRPFFDKLGDRAPSAYLTQDAIVGSMDRELRHVEEQRTGRLSTQEPRQMTVILGREAVSPEEVAKNQALIREFANRSVNPEIKSMAKADYQTFLATHMGLEWNSKSNNGAPDVLAQAMGRTKTLWKQDRTESPAFRRAEAKFIGGITTSAEAPEDMQGRLKAVKERLKGPGAQPSRKTYETISQLGRLGVQGEHRGIDIIALETEPGLSLFNAAGMLASTIRENNDADNENAKKAVGIVTGFTVVDQGGNKIGGENDGPPGAVTIAKFIIDQGTPVTIVCDEGSESSVLSAAHAIGLVVEIGDSNKGIEDVRKRGFFSDCKMTNGFDIEVVRQNQTVGNPVTPKTVKENLRNSNTALLISIERPSPNEEGRMSSMAGADISRFNADLSDLFPTEPADRSWATIGIGDGGNEIGTGNVADRTMNARKPDFTPVVKNGDKIAARAKTDETILASVSNNGGVLLTVATAEILQDLGHFEASTTFEGTQPVSRDQTVERASSIVGLYKATIDKMFREGISIDGVTKKNDRTVDGRELHRPSSSDRQTLGTDKATHDDFFDEMIDIVRRKPIYLGSGKTREAATATTTMRDQVMGKAAQRQESIYNK